MPARNTPSSNKPSDSSDQYNPPSSHNPSQHYPVRGTESDTPQRERGLDRYARGALTPIPFVLGKKGRS